MQDRTVKDYAMSNLKDRNRIIVAWWLRRFKLEEKRDEFSNALSEVLSDIPLSPANSDEANFYNDYDPFGSLLKAVRMCGIECRGFFFSGEDMFPNKTGILIRPSGEVQAKEGYGEKWITLWSP